MKIKHKQIFKKAHNGNCLSFLKCNSNCNDFIIFDRTEIGDVKSVDFGRYCNRKESIGADDVILFKGKDANSLSIRVINPDNSECPLCGNALLSTAKYISLLYPKLKNYKITTNVGCKQVTPMIDGSFRLHMGKFSNKEISLHRIEIDKKFYTVYYSNFGTPHGIIIVEDEDIAIEQIGSLIEKHETFPTTCNVMFLKILDFSTIRIQCWERGGTGKTLACGTGACASVITANYLSLVDKKVTVEFMNGDLKIELTENDYFMFGNASIDYVGTVSIFLKNHF